MLEQKLIVGRYIDLVLALPAVPAYPDGAFVRAPIVDCYLMESTGVFTKTSAVSAGAGPKLHRNFRWLPWLSGAIAEVDLVIADVLTGPMSGCWLAVYRKANGVPHAVHVGTDIARPDRTKAVNDAWNTFARAHTGDLVGGFNPLRHWEGDLPKAQGDDEKLNLYGLLTTDNRFFVVAAWQQRSPTTRLRIAGVQQVPSVAIDRLLHVDLPGP